MCGMPALYHPQRHIVPHLAELAGHEEVTLTLYCRAIRLGRSARVGSRRLSRIVCHRRPGPNVPYQLYYAYISHDHIRSRGARFVCVRSPISSPRPSLRPSSARRTRDTTTVLRSDNRVTTHESRRVTKMEPTDTIGIAVVHLDRSSSRVASTDADTGRRPTPGRRAR